MKEFPIERAFCFLEPGPVVLVTTKYRGRMNVMTMSWYMVMDFTPKIGCLIGPWDYSYRALRKTGECVIAVPAVNLMNRTVDIGNCSGGEIDKFSRFRLTVAEGKDVGAPLITQCLANIECRITDTGLVSRHNLFIMEGVRAWTNPELKDRRTFHANGDGTFVIDGKIRNLRKRMTRWQSVI